jgi:hypothetical protein
MIRSKAWTRQRTIGGESSDRVWKLPRPQGAEYDTVATLRTARRSLLADSPDLDTKDGGDDHERVDESVASATKLFFGPSLSSKPIR